MIKKYTKKPIPIEALQWTGDNFFEISEFCISGTRPIHAIDGLLEIQTLEGNMLANNGDYIIKGVRGEVYPCKEDIFLETYEEVKDD